MLCTWKALSHNPRGCTHTSTYVHAKISAKLLVKLPVRTQIRTLKAACYGPIRVIQKKRKEACRIYDLQLQRLLPYTGIRGSQFAGLPCPSFRANSQPLQLVEEATGSLSFAPVNKL